MTPSRWFLVAVSFVALTPACAPPTPTLGKLSAPAITAQRRLGGQLQVILTYDTTKTPCGAVQNLRATLDGQNVAASAGAFDPEAKTETERCTFPGFLIAPENKSTPRDIVFTDDVTTMTMTLSTLNLGTAIADSPPATIRGGAMLRWLTSLPGEGTSNFKVTFTPMGGAEALWLEGATLPATLNATVPPQTASASGDIALTWLVATQVTKCDGPVSCEAVVQGVVSYKAVVSP
jgi:hypothetical protein